MIELKEANEFKENLSEMKITQSKIISSLAHEFKTPLNGMLPFFENIKDFIHPEITQKVLNPLVGYYQILKLIVQDYLDFSKIYLGDFNLSYVAFDIKELVYKIISFVLVTKPLDGIKVEVIIDEKIQSLVRSDQNRFSQILYNLLGFHFYLLVYFYFFS